MNSVYKVPHITLLTGNILFKKSTVKLGNIISEKLPAKSVNILYEKISAKLVNKPSEQQLLQLSNILKIQLQLLYYIPLLIIDIKNATLIIKVIIDCRASAPKIGPYIVK